MVQGEWGSCVDRQVLEVLGLHEVSVMMVFAVTQGDTSHDIFLPIYKAIESQDWFK